MVRPLSLAGVFVPVVVVLAACERVVGPRGGSVVKRGEKGGELAVPGLGLDDDALAARG